MTYPHPHVRTPVLYDVLHLWAAVLDGQAASALSGDPVDRVLAAVGKHVIVGGDLCSVAELRRLLRQWLEPRTGAPKIDRDVYDYDVFLVSWGLSAKSGALARWREAGSPRRTDPWPHLRRATAWHNDEPAEGRAVYTYLAEAQLVPAGDTANRVDAAVERLLDVGIGFGEVKLGRLKDQMRELLTAPISRQLDLFDTGDTGTAPTTEVTRLAFILAVGVMLGTYAETVLDGADVGVRSLCDDTRARWNNPDELEELRRLCIDYSILEDPDRNVPAERLGVNYADFRAIFRSFANIGSRFAAEPPTGRAKATDVRRVGVLLELAIADVATDASDLPTSVAEQLAILVDEVFDIVGQQHELPDMLKLQERLRERTPRRVAERRAGGMTYLEDLLIRLAEGNRIGKPIVSGSDTMASWDDIDRLVYWAHAFLEGRHDYRTEWLIQQFAERLPEAVRTLTSGQDTAMPGHVAAADARWQLLEASGRALVQRPDMVDGLVVAGSLADLGWFVANEQDPERMRAVYEPLHSKLRSVQTGQLPHDLVGPITRILRTRPLADNKHDNFDIAQRAANDSVRYGSRMLREVVDNGQISTVSRIAAALTGFQLSLLQAGGVFVRSAEAELTYPGATATDDRPRGSYTRDLSAVAVTYTNLAVQRLKDIRDLEKLRLLTAKEINYPATAAASTAAMGMRTLLLWATLHLAFPDRSGPDVRAFIPGTPGQFHDMLRLRHLNALNFADMTRIAMHFAFLSGDFRHPATGARDSHPDTPEHLRPRSRGELDLRACSQYLIDNGYDAGILDVIRMRRVHRVLDETSDGRFGEWLASYTNRRRRRPETFRRGEVSRVAFAGQLRDPVLGW